MGSDKTWTRRAAVGSLVSGGGFLLFGTGGSTQISSNRDVTVNTGDGDDAVLQFVDKSEGKIVDSDNSPLVYRVRDNVGTFESDDLDVDARVGDKRIPATVSTNGDAFDVTVSCSADTSGLIGEYAVELDFTASNPEFTITATRTTGPVEFDCYDFGDLNNYRDSGEVGKAAQPDNPKGTLEHPGNVNDGNDDTFATAVAACNGSGRGGSNKGGRVGYALPPVEPGGEYELEVEYKNSSGKWNAYLRADDGTEGGNDLTGKYNLTGGGENERSETIEFDSAENSAISNNADNLFLIFETTSNGNCVSVDIDYFELRKTGTSSN